MSPYNIGMYAAAAAHVGGTVFEDIRLDVQREKQAEQVLLNNDSQGESFCRDPQL
jgi:hypothetical protein